MENALEKIYTAALRFLIPLSPEETYRTIVEESMRLVEGDIGSILLVRNDELDRVYSSDQRMFSIKPRRRGIMYNVFKSHKPVILRTTEIVPVHPEIKDIKGPRTDITVPLSYRNQAIGVLTVLSKQYKEYGDKELDILKYFGPLATLAIIKTQLYDETRQALELRDIFMSMAAHELRTPLTTLSGYIQLLSNKHTQDDTESRWIKEMVKESGRLKTLINEFLQVNKIKSGQLHYEFAPCKIAQIVEQAIMSFSITHAEREILFTNKVAKGRDVVIGDADKLLQVVINIIENALKYSPPDSPVLVNLSEKPQQLRLEIIDKGRGIHKKDLDHIFEGFYRGENSQEQGMGLGLYLAKNIIDAHHGDIHLHSKLNKGTTSHISLQKVKV